uniref:Uncharacterized protein n=1 Tax=Timema bartmani TaxID=61472 RepID=A0A7R9I3L3_9NEOP|nr:unnamed protein product [Timema bartmani]
MTMSFSLEAWEQKERVRGSKFPEHAQTIHGLSKRMLDNSYLSFRMLPTEHIQFAHLVGLLFLGVAKLSWRAANLGPSSQSHIVRVAVCWWSRCLAETGQMGSKRTVVLSEGADAIEVEAQQNYFDELNRDLDEFDADKLENHFGKTTLSTPDRDLNFDLPVIGSLAYCKSRALGYTATEAGSTGTGSGVTLLFISVTGCTVTGPEQPCSFMLQRYFGAVVQDCEKKEQVKETGPVVEQYQIAPAPLKEQFFPSLY